MKKSRVLAAVLAGTMLLTACGGGGGTTTTQDNSEAKNYVYKEEPLEWLNAEEFANKNLILQDGMIYVEEYIYPGMEEGAVGGGGAVQLPMVRNVAMTGEIAVEEAVPAPMPEAAEGEVPIHTYTAYNIAGEKVGEYSFKQENNSNTGAFVTDPQGNFYVAIRQYASYIGEDTQDKNFLAAMGPDGTELWRVPMGEGVQDYWLNDLHLMADGSIAVIDTTGITLYDAQGNKGRSVPLEANLMNNGGMVYPIRDGKFAIMGDYEKNTIQTLDMETGAKGEEVEVPFLRYQYSYYSGPDFDLYLADGNGVYGYNIGNAELVKIADFVESDLGLSYINGLSIVSETEMLVTYYDRVDYKQKISLLVKVPPEEVKDKEILTLACVYLDDTIRQQLINFNKTNDQYRIRIEDYSKYNTQEDYTLGYTRLNTDIISGKMPDILLINNQMPVNSYISKGLLADFNAFMEKDPEFNRDDYLTNIFDAYSIDGKLYQLTPQFTVTTVAGKTSNVGTTPGWTLDDMKKLVESKPEGTQAFFDVTKEGFLNNYIWMCSGQLVNWETGECYFNTDNFVKVLEYANSLPEKLDENRYNDETFWRNYEVMYREDQVLLSMYGLSGYRDYNNLEQRTFGEEVTLIGFPTDSKDGSSITAYTTFAINAKSKNQDAAWGFVKYFLSDEYQDKLEWGWPVKLSSLEVQAKKSQEKPFYMDENGQKVEYDETYWIGDAEIKIEPMTQAKIDKVNEFLKGLTQVTNYDDKLLNIVMEEAASYFSGQKNVQEVTDIIQNRAKTYVSENR